MYGETFYGRHTAQHHLQWRQIKIKQWVPLRAMKTFIRMMTAVPSLTLMKTANGKTDVFPCLASVENGKPENNCWILIKNDTTIVSLILLQTFTFTQWNSPQFLNDVNVQPKRRFKSQIKHFFAFRHPTRILYILFWWFRFKMRIQAVWNAFNIA